MSYQIIVERPAERYLRRRVAPVYAERIRRTIDDLTDNPRPPGCRKLQGRESWRIRVGDYRIVYEVDDDQRVVTIFGSDPVETSTAKGKKIATPQIHT